MEKHEAAGLLTGLNDLYSETFFRLAEVYFSTGVLFLDLSLRSAREQVEGIQKTLRFSKQIFY